jgi:hypothetical protein
VNVHCAESLTVLVGLVNRVDAVNESDAQLLECSENGALGLFSADGRKGSGDADTRIRDVFTTRFFTARFFTARFFTARFFTAVITAGFFTTVITITRNVTLSIVSGTTASVGGRRVTGVGS